MFAIFPLSAANVRDNTQHVITAHLVHPTQQSLGQDMLPASLLQKRKESDMLVAGGAVFIVPMVMIKSYD